MQSLSFIKELEEEEVESLCFFFFFPWAKWTTGCGAWQGQKRETQRNVWGATDGALLEGIFSGLFSSHSPTAYYVSFI